MVFFDLLQIHHIKELFEYEALWNTLITTSAIIFETIVYHKNKEKSKALISQWIYNNRIKVNTSSVKR